MEKYITSISIDISYDDVKTNPIVNSKIERELQNINNKNKGVKSTISNITGDDIVITSLVPENLINETNKNILKILKKYAEGFDDLNGLSDNPDDAGESISYATAKVASDYGDALIISFDTYGGEDMVNEMALFVKDIGEKYGFDVGCSIYDKPKNIEGIGYTGVSTDDPVIIITFKTLEELPKLAGIIFGGLLSFDNLYFVKKGTGTNILPPGVIYTMSAFLNGNVIDLYEGIKRRYNLL
ncbi:hypothetical protein [Methanococcus aeolicus]|uniref:hypothetical protein n=1 Tax=Methanococcus aeolicus TaxID=42879 RepID=UPI0021C68502|nr:hypothetical protein [Methanococcus aeolicus]UXM84142.1 hypothetical protein N6C89_05105 [Methanococcus aeolicus]